MQNCISFRCQHLNKYGACCGKLARHRHYDTSERTKAKTMMNDPICGMSVDEAGAFYAERDDKTYYFCSEYCQKTYLDGGQQRVDGGGRTRRFAIVASPLQSLEILPRWPNNR